MSKITFTDDAGNTQDVALPAGITITVAPPVPVTPPAPTLIGMTLTADKDVTALKVGDVFTVSAVLNFSDGTTKPVASNAFSGFDKAIVANANSWTATFTAKAAGTTTITDSSAGVAGKLKVTVLADALPVDPTSTPTSTSTDPAPVSPPRGATGAAQLSGTLADGTTIDVSCDAGERVRLIPGSIAGGSLVVHDDGASTCIENCYAGLTGDLTGNFTLQGNGTQLFSGPLTIWAYAHTRPWWLTQPTVQANADLSMFPKYGPGSESASWYASYLKGDNGPMGIGNTLAGIGSGGERPALGPLPQWLACYLTNPTPENLEVVLGMETSSGPWAAHCIDPKTEKMLLASDYQFATMLDAFYGQKDNPIVKFTSATPLNIAQARTHATVYCALGAALFGNSYFKDELSQWTNYIQCLSDNPTYRITPGSCLAGGAPRGKARGLTLQAYASRYSAHPTMFDQWMQDTATKWNALYLSQTGLQVDRNTGGYPDHGFAPWQMHALIYAIGHAMHMGYSQFKPTFDYFAKWLLDCVLTDHEFSTAYNLALADANGNVAVDSAQSLQFTAVNSVNITNALKYPEDSAERIAAFFPGNAAYKAGDFSGNPWVADSFAIQLKSPLAMCVDHATDQARAQAAWAKYESHFRADVSKNPKYNIVPRAA